MTNNIINIVKEVLYISLNLIRKNSFIFFMSWTLHITLHFMNYTLQIVHIMYCANCTVKHYNLQNFVQLFRLKDKNVIIKNWQYTS